MKALAEACANGEIPVGVAGVITPKPDNTGAEWAREHGIEVRVISAKAEGEAYADRLFDALRELGATHICLAGYMRLLPKSVLDAYPNRILNIHPALLPKFGGHGMYGIHVHEAVLASGDAESGCSVHVVTENYDEGPVILQMKCPVEPDDTPESLAARVLALEVQAYKAALKMVIEGEPARG